MNFILEAIAPAGPATDAPIHPGSAAHKRQLTVYGDRLIRPRFVLGAIRLVLRFMGKKAAA